MSITQVAERSGLSRPMISYVEQRTRNPTLDTLVRITIALNVDLSRLIATVNRRAREKRELPNRSPLSLVPE